MSVQKKGAGDVRCYTGVGRPSTTQTVRSFGACSATWSGSRVASATSANHVFNTIASGGMFSCSHASRSSLTHTSVEPVVRLWPCATSCSSLSASSVTASDESECARRASHRACVAETRRGLGIRCRDEWIRFGLSTQWSVPASAMRGIILPLFNYARHCFS